MENLTIKMESFKRLINCLFMKEGLKMDCLMVKVLLLGKMVKNILVIFKKENFMDKVHIFGRMVESLKVIIKKV